MDARPFWNHWLVMAWALMWTSLAQAESLPAFRDIVRDNRASVVHISVEGRAQKAPAAMHQDPRLRGSPFEHFFRRFGPPNGQAPSPQRGMGSGFIISKDGQVMTNAHVVKDAARILVRLSDRREVEATLIGLDEASDIALLKIEADGLRPVKLGDSDKLVVGDWVLAIGSPFGFDHTATQGIVSALGRSLPDDTYVPFIQTDVAVNPGNSGGPLFNTAGEVIGVNAQIYSRSGGYMGLSFSIPVNSALRVAQQLADNGEVVRGWLGVSIQPVNQDLAGAFGLDRPRGALVAGVTPDSPADRAGLLEGDVILRFNGKEIQVADDLPPLVGETPIGKRTSMFVLRNGKERKLKVRIARLEDNSQVASTDAGSLSPAAAMRLEVAPLSAAERARFGTGDRGVRVVRVGPGPAQEAGLRPGDLLLRIGRMDLREPADLVEAVAMMPRGQHSSVLLVREGRSLFLALESPESASQG